MSFVAERVTVEVGGFSGGLWKWTRLTRYNESEADVTAEAWRFFEVEHGSRAYHGNPAASVERQQVPGLPSLVEARGAPRPQQRARKATGGYWQKRKVWTVNKHGVRQRRIKKIWIKKGRPATQPVTRPPVTYAPAAELKHGADEDRDTRGGERRRRWN